MQGLSPRPHQIHACPLPLTAGPACSHQASPPLPPARGPCSSTGAGSSAGEKWQVGMASEAVRVQALGSHAGHLPSPNVAAGFQSHGTVQGWRSMRSVPSLRRLTMKAAPIIATHLHQMQRDAQVVAELPGDAVVLQGVTPPVRQPGSGRRRRPHLRWMRSLAMARSTSSTMVRASPAAGSQVEAGGAGERCCEGGLP